MYLAFTELALNLFLKLLIGPDHSAGLVRSHVIENTEEGFDGIFTFSVSPVSSGAVFVPGFRDEPVGRTGVVIRFDVVGGVVALLSKKTGPTFYKVG